VSSIWFLLSTGSEVWYSELLLFSPGNSCIVLQGQLCPVGSSPSKLEKFSFEYRPQPYETTSGIHHWPHFGRLACRPIPALSLCASPHLCLVLVQLLWEVHLSPALVLSLPHHPLPSLFTESSAPCPTIFPRAGSVFHPTPAVSVRLQSAVYAFQFCWGRGEILSAQGLCWNMFPGDK
jgi:hypothetical protein